MRKKTLILLSALMATISANAWDFYSEYNGKDIYYQCTSANTIEVTAWEPDTYVYEGDVIIPAEVSDSGKTYTVTGIGSCAFAGCAALTSVVLPNTITEIGISAFNSCWSLKSINIPESVTYIGDQAFRNCSALQSIELPNTITSIREETFFGCSNMTSVKIPDSVEYIGELAFLGCTNLSTLV